MRLVDKILYCVKGLQHIEGKKEVVINLDMTSLETLQAEIDDEFDEWEERFVIVREKAPNQLAYCHVLCMFGIHFTFYIKD